MSRYPLAGLAHKAIFFGFLVLLVRGLILFGRGLRRRIPGSASGSSTTGTVLGNVYGLIKDVYVRPRDPRHAGVPVPTGLVVRSRRRMTLNARRASRSSLIILVMMLADIVYDAASRVIVAAAAGWTVATPGFSIWEPLGSLTGRPR